MTNARVEKSICRTQQVDTILDVTMQRRSQQTRGDTRGPIHTRHQTRGVPTRARLKKSTVEWNRGKEDRKDLTLWASPGVKKKGRKGLKDLGPWGSIARGSAWSKK